MSRDPNDAMHEILSPREKQLLELAAAGFTDQAISNKIGISLATIGTYWGRVRIKFGPYNRTELVAIYLKSEAAETLSILKTENSDLISKIDEHSQTEQMLQASLDLFKGLIETAPDAILIINSKGEVELANEQADTMFGYGPHELLGLKVEDLIPERYREAHLENRAEYTEHPQRRKMGEHIATIAKRKDGTEFPVAAALNATQTPKGMLVTCIVRDMSEGREMVTAGAWKKASD
jgi:PAS domain S-box-containing protein